MRHDRDSERSVAELHSTCSREMEEERPRTSPCRLSRAYRARLVERGVHTLYRWYVAQSQNKRNWNPDGDFEWRHLRTDHDPRMMTIIEGFYAVEQYAPDYGAELTRLARRSYGRSHFYLRWAAEEERHASLWRNTLLFSGARTPQQLETLTDELRSRTWKPPWDDALHMLFYAVLQERATELIYFNLARAARDVADPVLANVATVIAADEAAHYHFFLEAARLNLYYFPEDALPALRGVLRNFLMPASTIVPNYDRFTMELHAAGLFGRIMYAREVVPPILKRLGVTDQRRLVRKKITVTEREGSGDFEAALCQVVNREALEATVIRLFAKLGQYRRALGPAEERIDRFVPHCWE